LTKKANNLMTVSGIIATLIMGLYGSLYGDTEQFTILGPLGILLFSVIAMITVVIYCVMLNKVEFQRTVFLGKNLVDNSTPNPKTIKSWTDSSKDDYYEALIDEYVLCLHQDEDVIEKKSTMLSGAIRIFLIGLFGFAIFFVIGMIF